MLNLPSILEAARYLSSAHVFHCKKVYRKLWLRGKNDFLARIFLRKSLYESEAQMARILENVKKSQGSISKVKCFLGKSQ